MRRILFLALLAAVGFWVAWPAYSGYRINSALKGGDAVALAGKIDFDSVRASLRPVATVEAERRLDESLSRSGAGAAVLGGDIKKQLLPKIVDGVLAALVTPETIIRIYRDGGAAKDAIGRVVAEQMGKPGGAGGALGGAGGAAGGLDKLGGLFGGGKKSPVRDVTDEPAKPADGSAAAKAPTQPPSYGLGNIKSFSFEGPFRMRAGVAKDPAATVADLTAEMSFTGADWKLTGLSPRF
ncbi:MAG: DUF2939 domain-containing protein [Hyphomicrobium sp.]